MANSRVQRGRKSQEILAEYYRENGWPDAEAVAAALKGRDIKKMLGLAPEAKATKKFDPTGALRQAEANADGDLPFAIYRPQGYGEAKLGKWVVLMNLDDHTQLLKDAGYGD